MCVDWIDKPNIILELLGFVPRPNLRTDLIIAKITKKAPALQAGMNSFIF